MSTFVPKNEQTSKLALAVQNLDISGRDHGMYVLSTSTPVGANLGTASNYAVLAGSTVTNTGSSVITGDLGVSPGTAVIGFPPGTVVGGSIHSADASAAQAQTDLTAAYIALAALTANVDLTGQDLGSVGTLTPDVYEFNTSAGLTGTLTLDFQNSPSTFFVFQIGSTLTTASASSIVMINGGSANRIFWQVGSSATLGTSSTFLGNIVALTSITATTSTAITGRTLARNGAVTLDTNTVNSAAAGGAGYCTVPIRERLLQVDFAQVKVNSSNLYTQFSQSSLSIVDFTTGLPGGENNAIKIAGLSSLADGDNLTLKYRNIK